MDYNTVQPAHLETLAAIVGRDNVSTGTSNLDLHAKDESHHPACRPEVVLWPTTAEQVAAILRLAAQHRLPVTGWGSGSSLEGNPIPVCRGLVLDFARMNRILDIRPADFQADVEPGVVYQDLNAALRHEGLFFAPDPGARATIGGMIANNASGTRTLRYGGTRANVLRLAVALPDGEIVRTGTRASKSSSGYDLLHLFIGSEGTLGIIVEATVRLIGLPEHFSAAVANFPTVAAAGKAVFDIMRSGLQPAMLELLAPECVQLMNAEAGLELNPAPTLCMEFHSASATHLEEIMAYLHEVCSGLGCQDFRAGIGREQRDRLLKARHELAEMIKRHHPGRSMTVIDVAVPISAYPEIIALARDAALEARIPGYTFGHAGDGNLHLLFMGRDGDAAEWAAIERVNERIVQKALDLGGTATGEHGVGIGKRRFMAAEHGNSLNWMQRIKGLFDPCRILNPGKMFPEPGAFSGPTPAG